jgi:hypothetical protein
MPSLWRESLGLVPIEPMANGIPVLASECGALPETLGEAGFVFTIQEWCTPASGTVPTAQEVAPWVAVIERLWDDPEFEAEHRRRALAEAMRWDGERLGNSSRVFSRDSFPVGRTPLCPSLRRKRRLKGTFLRDESSRSGGHIYELRVRPKPNLRQNRLYRIVKRHPLSRCPARR